MFKQLLISTRFGNLAIMALAQWLALNSFSFYNKRSVLMVIVATSCIALAGYIINDKFDFKIDQINRPNQNLFEMKWFRKMGIWLFAFLNLAGLVIGFFLDLRLLVLFVAVIILLFLYSYKLKQLAIIGNLIAALIQAAVFAPCFLFVNYSSSITPGIHLSISDFGFWFLCMMVFFAFITAFFREWVKDIEDLEGDKSQGLKTSAIIWSLEINRSLLKVIALVLILLVLSFTISLFFENFYSDGVLTYYFMFLILPVSIRSFIMLIKQKEPTNWSKLSSWLKMLMLAGVLSIGIL